MSVDRRADVHDLGPEPLADLRYVGADLHDVVSDARADARADARQTLFVAHGSPHIDAHVRANDPRAERRAVCGANFSAHIRPDGASVGHSGLGAHARAAAGADAAS